MTAAIIALSIVDGIADIAALATLTQNYTNMVNQTAQIEATLQAILQEWQQLDSDVSQAVSDIQTAIADKTSANFTAVVTVRPNLRR